MVFSSTPPSPLGNFSGLKEHNCCLQKQKKNNKEQQHTALKPDLGGEGEVHVWEEAPSRVLCLGSNAWISTSRYYRIQSADYFDVRKWMEWLVQGCCIEFGFKGILCFYLHPLHIEIIVQVCKMTWCPTFHSCKRHLCVSHSYPQNVTTPDDKEQIWIYCPALVRPGNWLPFRVCVISISKPIILRTAHR